MSGEAIVIEKKKSSKQTKFGLFERNFAHLFANLHRHKICSTPNTNTS